MFLQINDVDYVETPCLGLFRHHCKAFSFHARSMCDRLHFLLTFEKLYLSLFPLPGYNAVNVPANLWELILTTLFKHCSRSENNAFYIVRR